MAKDKISVPKLGTMNMENEKNKIHLIPIENISIQDNVRFHDDGNQTNSSLSIDDLNELKESIKQHGLIHPITVFYDNDNSNYVCLIGNRRLLACRTLLEEEIKNNNNNSQLVEDKFKNIKSMVYSTKPDEKTIKSIQISENVQRKDLTDAEIYDTINYFKTELNYSLDRMGKEVFNKSESWMKHHSAAAFAINKINTEIKKNIQKMEIEIESNEADEDEEIIKEIITEKKKKLEEKLITPEKINEIGLKPFQELAKIEDVEIETKTDIIDKAIKQVQQTPVSDDDFSKDNDRPEEFVKKEVQKKIKENPQIEKKKKKKKPTQEKKQETYSLSIEIKESKADLIMHIKCPDEAVYKNAIQTLKRNFVTSFQ